MGKRKNAIMRRFFFFILSSVLLIRAGEIHVLAEEYFEEAPEITDGEGNEEVAETGDLTVLHVVADEDKVKAYIRGGDTSGKQSYQIGNIPVESLKAYPISKDKNPPRTLLMLDNSFSIPKGSRDRIKELMIGIIDAHGEKERYRIATFEKGVHYLSDHYSDDYTMLKTTVNSIVHEDLNTYLTDVLKEAVDELNSDNYMGYTRIIIISDGVDENPEGVTREELNALLQKTPYPVYTVGISTGKNDVQLKHLFALSRLTNVEYNVLEKADVSVLVSDFSKDKSIGVFEAVIPEDAKQGGKQGSKLTFENGNSVTFDVELPFSIREEKTEVVQEPAEKPAEEPPEEEPAKEEESGWKDKLPLYLVIGGGALALLLLLILIFVLRARSKKRANAAMGSLGNQNEIQNTAFIDNELTSIMGKDNATGMGSPLFPGQPGKKLKYRVTFQDKRNMSRTFQCELEKNIFIGRASSNDVNIGYDGNVSRQHCEIINKNGRIFIRDLNSSNGTKVDGQIISFDKEIVSGSTIKIGATELSVKFEQI